MHKHTRTNANKPVRLTHALAHVVCAVGLPPFAESITGKCGENTASSEDVNCSSGDGTTATNTQNRGASVTGNTIDVCCTEVTCLEDQRVVGNACVACPLGRFRPAGDGANGADTACSGALLLLHVFPTLSPPTLRPSLRYVAALILKPVVPL